MIKKKLLNAPVAVCLAAGFGTRMRPLTENCPKPLIKVDGISMLDRVVDTLINSGIATIAINGHYLKEQIAAFVKKRQSFDHATHFIYSPEDEIKDSGGGVKAALELIDAIEMPRLTHDAVMVINADQVWQDEENTNIIHDMVKSWDDLNRTEHCDVLLTCVKPDQALGYDGLGDFTHDEKGLLKRITPSTEPVERTVVFTGLSLIRRSWLYDENTEVFSLNRIFDRAIKENSCFMQPLKGRWYHIGTPEALQQAEKDLEGNKKHSREQHNTI